MVIFWGFIEDNVYILSMPSSLEDTRHRTWKSQQNLTEFSPKSVAGVSLFV
jgi:hypothetical protein